MKTLNLKNKFSTLVLSTLTTTLILGCASLPSRSIAGERDRGGGNVPVSERATFAEIQKILNDIQLPIRFNLNQLEVMADELKNHPEKFKNDPNFVKLINSWFDGKNSIFDLMKTTAFDLRQTEPCFDKDNNPSDGSIHHTKPGTICISYYRISQKVSKVEMYNALARLQIHELTHLIAGDNEDLPEYAEYFIKDKITMRSFALATQMLHDAKSAIKYAQKYIADFESNDLANLLTPACFSISNELNEINKLSVSGSESMNVLPISEQMNRSMTLLLKTVNIMYGRCAKILDPTNLNFVKYNNAFASRQEMSGTEFYLTLMNGTSTPNQSTDQIVIRKLNPDNSINLSDELNDLKLEIQVFSERIQSISSNTK